GEEGAKLVADPDAMIRRIHADDSVLAFMRNHMAPGMVMVTTDLPMTPDTRTGKDFVVMNSGES
ncbi:MAG: L,D-transpeptidase, partial [Rhizobiales bacterium]|nr:L,D-transpeptidase [Hyphomicrobiales bacterium]